MYFAHQIICYIETLELENSSHCPKKKDKKKTKRKQKKNSKFDRFASISLVTPRSFNIIK
jgi:hypothetical protein